MLSQEFYVAADKWARDNEHSKMITEWIKSRDSEQKHLWEVYQSDMQKYEAALEEYNSLTDVEARVDQKVREWQVKQAARQNNRDEREIASGGSSISDMYQSEEASDRE